MITVLYVDDEPALLDTCKKILERIGSVSVLTALSGKEALDTIRTVPCDAVVADYLMEDITGLDLLRIIRAEFPDLPFIIFTGKGREDVVIEAFEQGVDFYVQKGGDAKSQYAELAHKIERAVENRRMRKQLERTEERFQNFLKKFEGIAFQVNSSGHYYLLEGSVEETTGYSRDEVISGYVTLESMVHPEDRLQFMKDFMHLSTDPGFRADSLFRIIRKDSHIRWLHAILHNICGSGKDIIHIQGVLYDITYLKLAQDELARTEEKGRAIITKAPVTISVVDRTGRFLFINKTRPPRKPSDLIGTDAGEYLAPGMADAWDNALYRVFGTGEVMRLECSVPLGDELHEWLAHQVSPVTWDGIHAAALVVSSVITKVA